jgi:titin
MANGQQYTEHERHSARSAGAPTNLRVDFVGANQVNLIWSDNSSNESGFVVEQCRSKNCNNFVQVGQVGANVTTFLNTGLLSNTQYNYRVRAVNPGGNSAYSNTVTAKTLRQ